MPHLHCIATKSVVQNLVKPLSGEALIESCRVGPRRPRVCIEDNDAAVRVWAGRSSHYVRPVNGVDRFWSPVEISLNIMILANEGFCVSASGGFEVSDEYSKEFAVFGKLGLNLCQLSGARRARKKHFLPTCMSPGRHLVCWTSSSLIFRGR